MLIGLEYLKKILAEENYEAFSAINQVYLIDKTEQETYKKILEYQAEYLKLPPVSFIDDSIPAYEEHPLEYWQDKLEERYLQFNLEKIKATISDNRADLETKYTILNSILNRVATEAVFDVCRNDCLTVALKKRIEQIRENNLRYGLTGLPTGWATCDKVTGGYVEGDVVVFCGRPKKGKTMLLIYSVNKILEMGQKVMFVSMEMTKEQILQRLGALRASVRYNVFKDIISSFAELRLVNSLDAVKDNLIIVEGNLEKNIFAINALLIKERPDIVFIDGAYLVQSRKSYKTVWESVLNVIHDIKTLASKYKIPIVCSYQFKRGMSKDPSLDHIAFADAVGQIASVVVGILDHDDRSRRLEIIASRDSPVTSFVIHWDWERMNFSEIGGNNYGEQSETEESEPNFEDLLQYEEYF